MFQRQDAQFKKGFGFGFSERRVFDKTKYAFIPPPDHYYNLKTFSEFYREGVPNKCTFGEPWDRMKRKVDIDNRKNLDYITIDTISPCNYNPKPEKVKRFNGAFTLKGRFKRAEEHEVEKRSGPGPQVYTIADEVVKQTRFNNVLAGGHAPKDSLIIDKNPGPGSYDLPNSLADNSKKKSRYSRASLLHKNASFFS